MGQLGRQAGQPALGLRPVGAAAGQNSLAAAAGPLDMQAPERSEAASSPLQLPLLAIAADVHCLRIQHHRN